MTRRAALETLAHGLELALAGVRELVEAPDPDEWVDQRSSPLGRRRHCELAKSGALAGARLDARHWYVRRRVIDEYIDSHGGAPKPEATSEADEAAEILAFRAPKKRRS